jgi:hypothetical protein
VSSCAGVVLLAAYLLCDSLTPHFQDMLFQKHEDIRCDILGRFEYSGFEGGSSTPQPSKLLAEAQRLPVFFFYPVVSSHLSTLQKG